MTFLACEAKLNFGIVKIKNKIISFEREINFFPY